MTTGLYTLGFTDPVGDGSVTISKTDGDGFFAYRNFRQLDTDDGSAVGLRHLATDWNGSSDSDEKAYATFGGTLAYASGNAGGDRGGVVMINHILPDGSKYTTVYMHLTNIPPAILNGDIGDPIDARAFLGTSGFVKANQGLHVHYEVRTGHQDKYGLGFGYFDGNTGASLVVSGTTGGVDYADVRLDNGLRVRYLDPIDFTNKMRIIEGEFTSGADVIGVSQSGKVWHALGGADVVLGSSGGDALCGDGGRDWLEGRGGRDVLVGGASYDTIFGGSSGDLFLFNSVSEIGKSQGSRDVIRDFDRAEDMIDLRNIDANSTTATNNAFKFVAAPGTIFSGYKGELRWFQQNLSGSANDKTIVMGDVNGDRVADFQLELTGLHTLRTIDFYL